MIIQKIFIEKLNKNIDEELKYLMKGLLDLVIVIRKNNDLNQGNYLGLAIFLNELKKKYFEEKFIKELNDLVNIFEKEININWEEYNNDPQPCLEQFIILITQLYKTDYEVKNSE